MCENYSSNVVSELLFTNALLTLEENNVCGGIRYTIYDQKTPDTFDFVLFVESFK